MDKILNRIVGPRKSMKIVIYSLFLCVLGSCFSGQPEAQSKAVDQFPEKDIAAADAVVEEMRPAIYQLHYSIDSLKNKRIAIVANHTSLIDGTHLLDTLIGWGMEVTKVFAPEHGFRGNVADGGKVDDTVDGKTGTPIISLYGKNKKPQSGQLAGVDLVIFDMQDVGARFYTYLSTLHNVMEACAESGIELWVLDRPNPNGHYIDGPVLKPGFESFIGMHPVPVVYSMTIGEYARMINGEGWLKNGIRCDLRVVECVNFDRSVVYVLPVKPSPNLPDMEAITLYPSLCFFEGTIVSVGRGTPRPFTVIGEPSNIKGNFTFVPQPIAGASVDPPQKGKTCRGYNLSADSGNFRKFDRLELKWLLRMYNETAEKEKFFLPNNFIDKLAGTDQLRKDILSGKSEDSIRKSWSIDLENFKKVREKYLIYPDI